MEGELSRALVIEDFDQYDWPNRIAAANAAECFPMYRLFDEAYGSTPELDHVGRKVYRFLVQASSGFLDADSVLRPFRPVMEGPDGRWPIPDDLPENELHLLAELAAKTADPELRARFADVAWQRARHFPSALLAVATYIESAHRLDSLGDWIDARDRLERALRIGLQLGRSHAEKVNQVVAAVEGLIDQHEASGRRLLLPARLMDLLIEFGLGDKDRWAVYAAELAEKAELRADYDIAKDYWQRKAAWEHVRGDEASRREAEVRAAEVQVKIADSYLNRPEPDYLSSSLQLQMAVEMLRQAGASTRAEELHAELLRRERYSYDQMKAITHSIDIGHLVEQAESAVRGQTLIDGLLRLAMLVELPKLDRLKAQVLQNTEEFALAHLFSSSRVDWQGRVVANKPSIHSADPEQVEEAILVEMFEKSAEIQRLSSQSCIRWARELLMREHVIRARACYAVVDARDRSGRADVSASKAKAT